MKNRVKFGFSWMILLSVVLLSGCATSYVNGATKEISASEFKKPEELHPVQLLFEFQTNGVANDVATDYLKEQVLNQIKLSGLFTNVSAQPVTGGALLSLTLNNVAITDAAVSQGTVTGLTLGLVGSEITDGYVCTGSYMYDASSQAIEKSASHAIFTILGNASAPPNAIKTANADEAVTMMTRQIVSNVLNDLSLDPSFK